MIRGLEITFLMLDPTDGMLSLMIASFLSQIRQALIAAYSREAEREADELGTRLAAMACFDTESGSNIFLNMHKADAKNNMAGKDFMSSHPASRDRYEYVKELSKTVNASNFGYCSNLKRGIGRALTLKSKMK